MVDENLYKDLRELLNGPYDKYAKTMSKDFRVDIWVLIPQVMSDMVNFGTVCLGTFRIEGKEDLITNHLTRKLKDIMDSIANEAKPEIKDMISMNNLVLTVGGVQFFSDDGKTVWERKDGCNIVLRNNLLLVKGGQGIRIANLGAYYLGMFKLSGVDETTATIDGLTAWGFPSVSWVSVDGIYQGIDRTFIKGVDKVDDILIPHSIGSVQGKLGGFIPVSVRFTDGTQINYFGHESWMLLSRRIDSLKDFKDSIKAPDVKYVVSTIDGKMESRWVKDTAVRAKADYWNGEVIRVRYFRDIYPYPMPEAGDNNELTVGMKLKNGDTIASFFVPTLYSEMPTTITAFDSDIHPKLVDYSSDGDILVGASKDGRIESFKVRKGAKYSDPKDYIFAVVGNHMEGIPEFPTWATSDTDRIKRIEDMASKNPVDVVIDNLRTPKSTFRVKESLGGKAIRRITISRFDKNMNPLEFGIENDEGDKMILTYGSPDTMSMRFDVPTMDHLKELDDYYNDIAAQMEGKAKIRATKLDEWRKKDKSQSDIFNAVSKKVKMVPSGLSGITMINSDKLARGETIEIRGA